MRKAEIIHVSTRYNYKLAKLQQWYWYVAQDFNRKRYGWSETTKPMYNFPKMAFHLLTTKEPTWKPKSTNPTSPKKT